MSQDAKREMKRVDIADFEMPSATYTLDNLQEKLVKLRAMCVGYENCTLDFLDCFDSVSVTLAGDRLETLEEANSREATEVRHEESQRYNLNKKIKAASDLLSENGYSVSKE